MVGYWTKPLRFLLQTYVGFSNNRAHKICSFARLHPTALLLLVTVLPSQGQSAQWIQVTSAAPWSARAYHSSVVFDNKIWVMGGKDPILKNDVLT